MIWRASSIRREAVMTPEQLTLDGEVARGGRHAAAGVQLRRPLDDVVEVEPRQLSPGRGRPVVAAGEVARKVEPVLRVVPVPQPVQDLPPVAVEAAREVRGLLER